MAYSLRWLFLDLNSYFASVEQADDPRLVGKPVAVVPMLADTTSCLASSYEAKAYGIKTGTRVSEAKKLCPRIIFVTSSHTKYSIYQKRILTAVEKSLPIHKIYSIDELACRLLGREQLPHNAIAIAKEIKTTIAKDVHPSLTCFIGIAPNTYGHARADLIRLLSKAARRMREDGYYCQELHLHIKFLTGSNSVQYWENKSRFPETQNTAVLVEEFQRLFHGVPELKFFRVGLVLSHLIHTDLHQLEDSAAEKLMVAIDNLNSKHRRDLIIYAGEIFK